MNKQNTSLAFSLALLLLMYLAVTHIVACTFLLFGASVCTASALLSVLFTVYLFMLTARGENTYRKLLVLSLGAFAVVLTLLAAGTVFDLSYDGNWYHKASLGSVAKGWNPLYSSLEVFAQNPEGVRIGNLAESAIWADHYCKFSWYVGASFYCLTGNIECGKALNLIAVLILALLLYSCFSPRLGKGRSAVLALLSSLNPITLSQSFTYYNDGLLMCVLFCLVVILVMTETSDKAPKAQLYLALFLCLTILLNIKFTGLLYGAVFCFSFYVLRLIRAYKAGEFASTFGRLSIFYAITVSFSALFLGASSYVKNTLQHKNPLYPLFGQGSVDIMSANSPKQILDAPIYKRLLLSLFSETSNIMGEGEIRTKLPFSVSEYEAKVAQSAPDLRIGGFGPFFGGIIVLSAAILLFAAVYLLLKDRKTLAVSCAVLLPSAALPLVISESWWARYSPYTYLFPLAALAFLMYLSKSADVYKKIPFLSAAVAFSMLLAVNCSFSAAYSVKNAIKSRQIADELTYLKVVSAYSAVDISFDSYAYYGIEYNFKDYGINYRIVPKRTGESENIGMKIYDGKGVCENVGAR